MSREERKMAQIIASIERMEQEARASGDDMSKAQETHERARQGGRGKKGKKGKLLGLKVKAGRKLKVSAEAEDTKASFERKLTPKKRWIQLWSAQLDTSKEKNSGSSSESAEKEVEDNVEIEEIASPTVASSPAIDAKFPPTSLAANPKEDVQSFPAKPLDLPMAPPLAPKQKANNTASVSTPVNMPAKESKAEEHNTEMHKTKTMDLLKGDGVVAAATFSSSELRVKTPLNNESSHLSPPLDRSSPTTTASISPSAKVKDSDTPNNNTAAAAATKFSPAATDDKIPIVTEKKDLLPKENAVPKLEREISSSSVGKGDDDCRRDDQCDRDGKRSLECMESPMSEEAKRRAERRRRRKSNWDVGDPRKGGSPVADLPISAAAAAANQQSFAKYPLSRPSWRHSQSMMDIKPHFQGSYRSSSFYNNGSNSGVRRGFYHSSSLPQDRSRSAGRSSSRYSYGTSSGSNYR